MIYTEVSDLSLNRLITVVVMTTSIFMATIIDNFQLKELYF